VTEDQVRGEAAEAVAWQVAAAEEQARREAAEEAAHRIASVAQQQRGQAQGRAVQDVTPVEAAAVELTGEHGSSKTAEPLMQTDGVAEQARREPAEDARRRVVAPAEERARDSSAGSLPLHNWIQRARPPDDPSEAADWPHALLRRKSDAG
jgi:hypothetical protein